MFSGLDEFSRLEDSCVVDTSQRFEKVCYFFSVCPQTRIGQARRPNELPISLFGDQIQYRRKIVTTVRFVSLFNHAERCTRIHLKDGGLGIVSSTIHSKGET